MNNTPHFDDNLGNFACASEHLFPANESYDMRSDGGKGRTNKGPGPHEYLKSLLLQEDLLERPWKIVSSLDEPEKEVSKKVRLLTTAPNPDKKGVD